MKRICASSVLQGSGLFALACVMMVGCGGDGALIGERVTNTAPDTEVTATPPVPQQTSFSVEFFWAGSDPDGEVAGYEWRISNNGPDGVVDPADTLTAGLPWNFTEATDSMFVVTADIDSFEIDVADTSQSPANYRFWQTHTFFVRAVDEHGARDPSPANVSFTATTLAPTARIVLPELRGSPITCVFSAKVLTFGWEATDPDDVVGVPDAIRYILKPVRTEAGAGCLTQYDYETANPPILRNDDPLWSRWIDAAAPNDSGLAVTLPRQEAGKRFLFAVQARDVAGAVTPVFEWNRNVRHVQTSDGKFPLLRVCETFLGCSNFVGTGGLKAFEVVAGQPLEFEWSANADEYAGIVDAYRYGWNVVDPTDENDPGWSVAWGNGPNWKRALPRTFTQGSPSFVVQCRDNSGTVSRAFYRFQVIQIADRANQRNLMLIDDWPLGTTAQEREFELLWDAEWEDLLASKVTGFQPNDVIDTSVDAARLDFALVNEYKALIWFTNSSETTFFHTRLAPADRELPKYNWLEIYQSKVGNLLITGPGVAYNSFEKFNFKLPVIFNIPAGGDLGFGTFELADGSEVNRGTTRWPYSAWCLEAVDYLRPAVGQISGELQGAGNLKRDQNCDALHRALVADEFLSAYPDADGVVRDLAPRQVRIDMLSLDPAVRARSAQYKFVFEEFYNSNVTSRNVALVLRSCQVPMWRWWARREEGLVANPREKCYPLNRDRSTLDGVPVAIVSSRYSDTKAVTGSEDFLWGFHPLAFERQAIQDAMLWIMGTRWELPVRR